MTKALKKLSLQKKIASAFAKAMADRSGALAMTEDIWLLNNPATFTGFGVGVISYLLVIISSLLHLAPLNANHSLRKDWKHKGSKPRTIG